MRTVMKTFVQRGIRTVVLVGLLGCGLAGAQEYTPDIKAALIASPESAKTLELKDGRIFTFRQLVELPEPERKTILRLYKNRSEHINFRDWELATVEAEGRRLDKGLAAAEAKADEATKRRAAAEAEGRRLDKELAETSGKIARLMTAWAAKSRKELAAGGKLSIGFNRFSQLVTGIDDHILKAGLSKEDADFLKSLLKRPELFEKP